MRAIIVDDDPTVSESLSLILRHAGYNSDTAGSIQEACQFALESRYDVAFIDLNLPDGDGYDCLSRLRETLPKLPVLIVSGLADQAHKIRGLEEGADDYITKPFDREELVARLHAVVRRSGPDVNDSVAKVSAAQGAALLARRGEAQSWCFEESYRSPDIPGPFSVQSPKGNEKTVIALEHEQPSSFEGRATEARILLCGNPKGGSGKTTLAINLLIALAYRGLRVVALDLDCPQFSLKRYLENRRTYLRKNRKDLHCPSCAFLDSGLLSESAYRRELATSGADADVILVDSQGTLTPTSRLVHRYADVIVTPVNESFVDLDLLGEPAQNTADISRLGPYGEMMQEIMQERAAAPPIWKVVKNRSSALYSRNSGNTTQFLNNLARHLNFETLPGLRERVLYRELFRDGLTLFDIADKDTGPRLSLSHVAARQETRRLLDAVESALFLKSNPSVTHQRRAGS